MLIPNMAGPTKSSTFVCSCFFTNNIFVKKYKLHVSYQDRSQFFDNYSKVSVRILDCSSSFLYGIGQLSVSVGYIAASM